MNRNIWHAEKYVLLLITYGFTLHIIGVAIYFRDGTANLSQIILPLVDLPLAIMMAYCALAMIFAWRQFFKVFDMRSTWRKVIYWIITVYIAGSVPGHIGFLMFGNTAYFDFFPWWFSVILLFGYGAIIAYFFSLKQFPIAVQQTSFRRHEFIQCIHIFLEHSGDVKAVSKIFLYVRVCPL